MKIGTKIEWNGREGVVYSIDETHEFPIIGKFNNEDGREGFSLVRLKESEIIERT